MKTAIKELMDIVEMEHNNGVQISMQAFYKMLKKALKKEKQQIIDAANEFAVMGEDDAEKYYNQTYGDIDLPF